jgi:hypothetical protein
MCGSRLLILKEKCIRTVGRGRGEGSRLAAEIDGTALLLDALSELGKDRVKLGSVEFY